MGGPDPPHFNPPSPDPGGFDLEAAFDEARRLTDPAAREAFLAGIASDDDRVALRAMLEADARAGPRIERLAEGTSQLAPSLHHAGERIGPFELIEPIGEGGFGEVWRARQTAPIARDVALKLIKPGMDSRLVIGRFEAERRTLAAMDHPHIARVLDAGVSERGHPYFAMELVDGEPLVEYCDRRRLPTAARLEIFATVCRAIQHAHQKGVIHRDIKPSNVMVSEHDGKAVPKVIDFGIAHALDATESAATRFTALGQLVGTPGYMSPEQASMTPDAVDTRSDVYSLGVLLYELLVGLPPFEAERLREAGYGEMLRIIREIDPPRPSTRFETLGNASAAVAAARGANARRMRQDLQGELDWVVMRCLAKEPSRRYDGASALADEIERVLRHEPVVAGPPSAAYRLRTFVRRHRVMVGAGAAITLALVAGIVGTTIGLVRAEAATAESRRTLYGAVVRLASEAVKIGDHEDARRTLDKAPVEHRGWEHDHLSARVAPGGWALEGLTLGPGPPRVLADGVGRRVYGLGCERLAAWDAVTGRTHYSVPLRTGRVDDPGFLFATADGAEVIVITRAPESLVPDVYDASTGRHLRRLPVIPGRSWGAIPTVVNEHFALSLWRDGRMELVIVNVRSGEHRTIYSTRAPQTHGPSGSHCAISPAGRVAAFNVKTLNPDGTDRDDSPALHVVRIEDGTRLSPTDVTGAPVGFVTDDRLVVWSNTRPPRIVTVGRPGHEALDARRGAATAPRGGPSTGAAAGPGWTAHLEPDGVVRFHDLESGAAHRFHPGRRASRRSTADLAARRLVVPWADAVRMYDLGPPGDPSVLVRRDQPVRLVEPLPDGKRVIVADWSGWFESRPGSLSVHDAVTGETLAFTLGPAQAVRDLLVHPREPIIVATIVTGAHDTRKKRAIFRAYDGVSGEMLWQHWPGGGFTSLAFAPDGRVVTVDVGPTPAVAVRDARTGKATAQMTIPGEDHSFSPVVLAGERILLVSVARNVQHLVDLDLRVIRTHAMPLDPGRGLESADVHPDGRRVALPRADRGAVTIIDAIDGTVIAEVGPHGGIVRTARFHPDGSRLFTGCDDGLIRIFETERFELVGTLAGHEGLVRHLTFMNDGRTLLSAGGDGTVRRWGLDSRDEHLRLAREREAQAEIVDAWLERAVAETTDRAAVLARIDAHDGFDDLQRVLARARLSRLIPFAIVPPDPPDS